MARMHRHREPEYRWRHVGNVLPLAAALGAAKYRIVVLRPEAIWGIAALQQYRTLFVVWFTYDEAGKPTWFVMPDGLWRDSATFEGRVYRASGAPWLGGPYDASAFKTVDVGLFRLRFTGDTASFEYTIEGRSGTMPLTRQPF